MVVSHPLNHTQQSDDSERLAAVGQIATAAFVVGSESFSKD